jgi:uncharacterized membrane protein
VSGPRERGEIALVVERNIQTLLARRREEQRRQTREEKVAAWIGRFAGSMQFVYLHLLVFGIWALWNSGLLPVPRFDASFVKLATFASVEAIFISTFVLITQNRMAAAADRRADLDLQISLLAEHEVTRLVRLVDEIAEQLGVQGSRRQEDLGELKRDVDPADVLERLERVESQQADPGAHPGD